MASDGDTVVSNTPSSSTINFRDRSVSLASPPDTASRFISVPTEGFYPPIDSEFDASDSETDRSRVVSTFVIEAHMDDKNLRDRGGIDLSKHSAACSPAFTGRFADSAVHPYKAADGKESATADSKALARSRPSNDAYLRMGSRQCADPRIASGTDMVVMRDYTCNMNVDPKTVEDAVVASVSTYPTKFYKFMVSFVDATMGAAMHDWCVGMADRIRGVHKDSVGSMLNVHSWKMLCLLGRPFGPDGAHVDVDAPALEQLQVSDEVFTQRCPLFDLFQCMLDHVGTYQGLGEMCGGLATSPMSAKIMLEVCNLWGIQWCQDVALVDPATMTPDYDNKLELLLPMNFNMGKENRMRNVPDWDATFHATKIPSCNPTLTANMETDMALLRDEVVHVPAVAVPAGHWMGKMPIGLDVALSGAGGGKDAVPLSAGISNETLRAAGGFRWGFGHSCMTFCRTSSGKFTNYFTPYLVSSSGERVPDTSYPIRIAVCRNWGADLFNTPDMWDLKTAHPTTTVEQKAEPVSEQEHLLPKHSDTSVDATYQGIRHETVTVVNIAGSWMPTSPGVYAKVPEGRSHDQYERPAGVCADRPLGAEHLPPDGPCTFAHNDSYFALAVDRGGTLPFASHTDLERCVTTSPDRRTLFVSSVLLYQGKNVSLPPGSSVEVELFPKVPDSKAYQHLCDTWGVSASTVTTQTNSEAISPTMDIDVSQGLGSQRDELLALRLAKLIVGRGVGMHLSHFLFTNMCACPANSSNVPVVASYLDTWYKKKESAFVRKFASLLRMYTSSRTKRTDDMSLLEEVVLLRPHLHNSGHSNASLRKHMHEDGNAGMLPILMPRCMPLRKTLERDAYLKRIDHVAQILSVTGGLTADSVHFQCNSSFGMEWLSLYSHAAHPVLDTQRSSTWPSEYAGLSADIPGDSFVTVLADGRTSVFAPHNANVFPADRAEQQRMSVVAGDPQNCFVYAAYREDPASDVVHLQAVADGGKVVGDKIWPLEDFRFSSSSRTAFVTIPPTYCWDTEATRLSAEAQAVVRTYAATAMRRMLTTQVGLPLTIGARIESAGRSVAADAVGGLRGIGHAQMTALGKHTWADGSTGPAQQESDTRTSAFAIFKERLPDLTFSRLRHLGLHPTTDARFRMSEDYLYNERCSTDDATGATSEAGGDLERPRVSGYLIEAMWESQDDSHGRLFSEPAAFRKFFTDPDSRLEDVALQCFTAHDYALQLRNVAHQAYNRYGGGKRSALYEAGDFGGSFVDELVNDQPFAHRLLVELDTALRIGPRTSASVRKARVASHPLMRLLDSLTHHALFEACDISVAGVTVASKAEGRYSAQVPPSLLLPEYRGNGSFYLDDPNGTLFASSLALSSSDTTRAYTLSSPDVVHLHSDLSKDREPPKNAIEVPMNNPNITNGALWFAMLDAGALLYHMRRHHNQADALRCVPRSESGRQPEDQHYSLVYLMEAMLCAREHHHESTVFELSARLREAMPTVMLGGISSQTWEREYAPSCDGDSVDDKVYFQDMLYRTRRLGSMWGTLGSDAADKKKDHAVWVPLPLAEMHTVMRILGTFDTARGIPMNPWADPKGKLRTVFRNSKHNAYRMSKTDPHSFANWQKLMRYTPPSRAWRPSSFYGGDLTLADFAKHRYEAMSPSLVGTDKERSYRDILRTRFGVVEDLELYRHKEGDLDCLCRTTHIPQNDDHRHRYASHFSSYARNLVCMGLAANTGRRHQPDHPDGATFGRFLNNWFRMYLSNACSCVDRNPGTDDVPVVMGYYVQGGKATCVASTLLCMYNKMNTLLATPAAHGLLPKMNAAMFGQVAAVVDAFVTREARRREYAKAYEEVAKEDPDTFGGPEGEARYYRKLCALLNEQIDFNSRIMIAMLVKAGMTPKELPLGALTVKTVDPKEILQPQDSVRDIGSAIDHLHEGTLANGTAAIVNDEHLTRRAMQVRELVPPGDAHVSVLLALRYKPHVPSNVPGGQDTSHIEAVEALKAQKWQHLATAMLNKSIGVKAVSLSARALKVSPKLDRKRGSRRAAALSPRAGQPHRSSTLERAANRSALLATDRLNAYALRVGDEQNARVAAAADKVLREVRRLSKSPPPPPGTPHTPLTFETLIDKLASRSGTRSTYDLDDPNIRRVVKRLFQDDLKTDFSAVA